MPLQPLAPQRLYRQIADQLRSLIERGEFPTGSRLPPERDLAVQLGVSRPSVREALIALEVEGRVEVRMGSGIYVREPGARAAAIHEAESPLETIRARALIEGELAAQAAMRMKRAQLAGLREALALMAQESAAGQTPTQGDRLFHTRIAAASDNSVLLRVVGELFDERHNPLFAQLGSHFENARSWAVAIEEHKAVVEAIAHQDPAAARAAMVRHLANSHDRFMASWPAEGDAPAKATARASAKPTARKRKVSA